MFHQEDARKPSGTGKVGSEYSGISDTASSPKNEICSMSLSDSAGIKDSASSAHPMIAQVHRTKISDEITCSVCLDILVRPITLVPCGHTFCQPCWSTAKRTDCPECRVTVKCFVPARQIDNMVATLASVPNLLDDDDRQVYLERTELYRQAVVVRLSDSLAMIEVSIFQHMTNKLLSHRYRYVNSDCRTQTEQKETNNGSAESEIMYLMLLLETQRRLCKGILLATILF